MESNRENLILPVSHGSAEGHFGSGGDHQWDLPIPLGKVESGDKLGSPQLLDQLQPSAAWDNHQTPSPHSGFGDHHDGARSGASGLLNDAIREHLCHPRSGALACEDLAVGLG